MTDRNKFEQMLEYLVNEDQAKAKEMFHQIVVEKSREIYENLLAEEFKDDDVEEGMEKDDVEEAMDDDDHEDMPTDEMMDQDMDDTEAAESFMIPWKLMMMMMTWAICPIWTPLTILKMM